MLPARAAMPTARTLGIQRWDSGCPMRWKSQAPVPSENTISAMSTPVKAGDHAGPDARTNALTIAVHAASMTAVNSVAPARRTQ
jgi:hypothetical protein